MQGAIRCVLLAGLLVGCHGEDTDHDDVDASVGGGGLVVRWQSSPESWPAVLGDGVTIDRATFACDNLRVVGDAATGDPRTAASNFSVRWDSDTKPAEVDFPDAPGGVYSQLSLGLDGHVSAPSIDLRGHVVLDGVTYELRVTDLSPFSTTLDMSTSLVPPATAMVTLRVDFKHALESIDYSMLENDGGRLELETFDPQMPLFRQKLTESFSIPSSQL